MREVDRPVVLVADNVPVRLEDNTSRWVVVFVVLAAIAMVIGGITMYNNNNMTTLRQQTIDLQQTSLQQQQQSTQQLQEMTAAQQAMQANKPATTNVDITDGLNGGAGPGSEAIAPRGAQAPATVNIQVPTPAAPVAPAQPVDSASSNP